MTTTIPNTSTSGTVGTPSPAGIGTDSLDGSLSTAATDAIQMVRLSPPERNALMALATLAGALTQGASSLQLRIILDAITTGVSLTVGTVTTVTSMTQIGGRDATTIVNDTSNNAWANQTMPCLARS